MLAPALRSAAATRQRAAAGAAGQNPGMGVEERYALLPQMEAYDRLGFRWLPFIMFFHPAGHRSAVVNTDELGFRYTVGPDGQRLGSSSTGEVNLLVGSSIVFGVGASSDSRTISSWLTRKSGEAWINFGGCSYTSTQELILFLTHQERFARIRRIVFVSGCADLLAFWRAPAPHPTLGAFFHSGQFHERVAAPPPERGGFAARVARACRDVLRRTPAGRETGAVTAPRDPEAEKPVVLEMLDRNLAHWKALAGARGASLHYFLQPNEDWFASRRRAAVEEEVFTLLDRGLSDTWSRVLRSVAEAGPWYRAGVRQVCERLAVPFGDVNELLDSPRHAGEPLFVDRFHLGDRGNEVVADAILGALEA